MITAPDEQCDFFNTLCIRIEGKNIFTVSNDDSVRNENFTDGIDKREIVRAFVFSPFIKLPTMVYVKRHASCSRYGIEKTNRKATATTSARVHIPLVVRVSICRVRERESEKKGRPNGTAAVDTTTKTKKNTSAKTTDFSQRHTRRRV